MAKDRESAIDGTIKLFFFYRLNNVVCGSNLSFVDVRVN